MGEGGWTWERGEGEGRGGGTWEKGDKGGQGERSKGRHRKALQGRVVVQGKPGGEGRRWEEDGADERGRDKGVK
jgi:hypothetical protein